MSRQNNRLLRLQFPNGDGPASLVANRLEALEGLSRDFQFTVECLSDDPAIALKDVQGKMVTVELVREDSSMRYFNGYVFEFRRVRADGGEVFYSMLLPWLAYLRLRRDNYLFHNMSVLDQTDDIFADYPVRNSDLRISGADPVMTDACQYDESDYNYLHRRWEANGWFYWYEHTASGHTLILSDDSVAAAPIDGRSDIPFQSAAGSLEDDGMAEWTPVRSLVPAVVALSSFDFKKPRPTKVNLPTVNMQGDVLRQEVYEYTGAYGFKHSADGDDRTRLRLQEIEAEGKHFEGAGNDRYAQPGRSFELTGHFDDGGTTFLILEVRHSASNNYQVGVDAPSHYENRMSCIRKEIPWRPGRGYNSTEPNEVWIRPTKSQNFRKNRNAATRGYGLEDRRIKYENGDYLRPLKEGTFTHSEARGYEQAYREIHGTKPDSQRGVRPGNVEEPLNLNRTGGRAESHIANYRNVIDKIRPGCA